MASWVPPRIRAFACSSAASWRALVSTCLCWLCEVAVVCMVLCGWRTLHWLHGIPFSFWVAMMCGNTLRRPAEGPPGKGAAAAASAGNAAAGARLASGSRSALRRAQTPLGGGSADARRDAGFGAPAGKRSAGRESLRPEECPAPAAGACSNESGVLDQVVCPQRAEPADPTFIVALASALEHAVAYPGTPAHMLTIFDSRQRPEITILGYLERMAERFRCSRECFVMAMVYLNRVEKLNPGFSISAYNIHRLLLGSMVLAAKFLDDRYYSNRHYAEIGGVKTLELNRLEVALLQLVKWNCHVTPDEYSFCHNRVLLEFGHPQATAALRTNPFNLAAAKSHTNPKKRGEHEDNGSHEDHGQRKRARDSRASTPCAVPSWGSAAAVPAKAALAQPPRRGGAPAGPAFQ